jgi:probable F420-dependent oxidoreductase
VVDSLRMRIGAKLPNSGPLSLELGIPAMARALEDAGVDSVWVADHVVLPRRIESHYPFAADGRATWPTDSPYLEVLIALALAAAATERVMLGTAALVLPLRNPVMFAKQAASIDVASGGRLELGVAAGWLEEEFAALDTPFAGRGTRLVEWIAIARECWSGAPGARSSENYVLPADVLCLPVPAHPIPLLIGGHSDVALGRAGRIGDGWLAQQSLNELRPVELVSGRRAMLASAERAGRDPERLRLVLRIVDSAGRADELAAALPALARAGVSEVIVDLGWDGRDQAADVAELRAGAQRR